MVASWTLVTLVVVFPAAFLAGIQFPLLIALLGRGRERVGRHVGAAYAWNTLGAIAGSLAGAFGLLPLLSAPDCWRLVAGLLCGLGAMSLLASLRHRGSWALAVATAVSLCFAVSCLSGPGPTAIWRHSGIGGGRAAEVRTPNGIKKWMNNWRREMVVDRDGRESSVGIVRGNDTALLVNGKSDGSARGDAGTQVGCGLVGAVLHPHPRSSIVVGLGTGTTAGWLARVPTMERVDVVELERVIVDAAHLYDDVNERAMSNPKVRTIVGDGREVLLMRGRKYDLIASEPSNPYRAGVASLFTREFYELASQRLADDGLFMQWMQLYSIHPKTAQTVYATITSVFPYVQTWSTASSDVILVASKKPIVVDVAQLRRRIASEPYRSAFFNVWRVDSAEGFLGRLIANETYATNAASRGGLQNTDDRTVIEFGFSRNIETSFSSVRQLITSEATRINALVPRVMRGSVDGPLLEASRFYLPAWWSTNEGAQALAALALAEQGNGEAEARANTLAARQPIEAAVIRGVLRMKLGFVDDATARFDDALRAYRLDPWPQKAVMDKAIEYALQAGLTSGERARVLYEAMEKPFAAGLMNRYRLYALQLLAAKFDPCGPRTIAALRVVEPNPFWNRESLVIRADCYARAGLTELGARASADLREFDASETEAIADSDR
jgi:predicted membrane-bound spermidine synthase